VPLGVCRECPEVVRVAATTVECVSRPPRLSPKADVRERALTTVGTVMQQQIVCVAKDAPLEDLERLALEHEHVAVVGARHRPMGIVGKTDVLRALDDLKADATAETIMTPIVHAIVEDAPLSHAIAMLAIEGVQCVPVVTHEGALVGILRSRDVIRWLARDLGYDVIAPGD